MGKGIDYEDSLQRIREHIEYSTLFSPKSFKMQRTEPVSSIFGSMRGVENLFVLLVSPHNLHSFYWRIYRTFDEDPLPTFSFHHEYYFVELL